MKHEENRIKNSFRVKNWNKSVELFNKTAKNILFYIELLKSDSYKGIKERDTALYNAEAITYQGVDEANSFIDVIELKKIQDQGVFLKLKKLRDSEIIKFIANKDDFNIDTIINNS